ncbi:tRNA lysidine(34) synthetase TilS, partial [Acidithiobacillus sp. MC6.1]|nr:tRNA lysidine(34) synthetase TilS [Acidithiobacillus sp. MC6.1]
GEGPEDQARRARYALMAAQLGQGDWLLTAQHLEDQAETLLLQLLRGAGVAGLAAMPWQRPLGAGLLIRPLLDVPQQVLRDYLEQWHLPFLNDPANADMRYDRVRVRNILLPQLRDMGWPHAAPNIARAADNLADMREIAADWFTLRWQQYRADYPELSAEQLALEYLQSLSAAAQRVFLRGWLQQRQIPVPSRERLEALRDAVMQRRGGARIQWEGGQAWLQGGLLRAWPQPRMMAEKEWEEGPWCAAQGDPLPIPGWQYALRDTPPEGFHHALAERFAETVVYWRRRREGELTLTGQGQHRPLKKLLLEAGVPPDRRAGVPLLWDEAGHLLLILGYYTAPWACASYKSRVLCLWNAGVQSSASSGVGST